MILHHTISIRWPLFSASRISQNVFFHLTDHQREDPPCLPKVIHYQSMPSLLIFISFMTLAIPLGIFTRLFLATLKYFAQNWKQRTRWAEGNRMGSMRGTRVFYSGKTLLGCCFSSLISWVVDQERQWLWLLDMSLRGMEALLFTDFPLLFLHNERVSLRRARFRSMLFKA